MVCSLWVPKSKCRIELHKIDGTIDNIDGWAPVTAIDVSQIIAIIPITFKGIRTHADFTYSYIKCKLNYACQIGFFEAVSAVCRLQPPTVYKKKRRNTPWRRPWFSGKVHLPKKRALKIFSMVLLKFSCKSQTTI